MANYKNKAIFRGLSSPKNLEFMEVFKRKGIGNRSGPNMQPELRFGYRKSDAFKWSSQTPIRNPAESLLSKWCFRAHINKNI